jgi:hypothetical protein
VNPGEPRATGAPAAPEDAGAAEVHRHHRVLADWLTGAAPRTPAAFAAFADAHGPAFTLVNPDGRTLDRAAVLAAVADAHATAPGLRITIADARTVADSGGVLVVAYRERHDGAGPTVERTATAVLLDTGGVLAWHHLHETWTAR